MKKAPNYNKIQKQKNNVSNAAQKNIKKYQLKKDEETKKRKIKNAINKTQFLRTLVGGPCGDIKKVKRVDW